VISPRLAPRTRGFHVVVATLIAFAGTAVPWQTFAQQDRGSGNNSLEVLAPDLHARLVALERAQGVLYGALVAGNGKVNESDVLRLMTRRLTDVGASSRPDPEADRGFAALGERAAALIRRGHAFHRDVLAGYAARTVVGRRAAIEDAVRSYRTDSGPRLPDAPKDMSILYDHPYSSFSQPKPPATEPRRELAYPALTGFIWSAHWYELAASEPFDRYDDPAGRDKALATVAERFQRKLSGGKPPDAFPTELPLAPAIAPGLVAVHERAAAILDNLNMMQTVIMDVLVHRAVANRQQAIDDVVAQFTNREYRCVQTDEWILMALRHSIFAQGGPALATMTADERNAFSGMHGQHYGRRAPPPCDPEKQP
jgi:hypothetical protein